jgi:hypothetical protein
MPVFVEFKDARVKMSRNSAAFHHKSCSVQSDSCLIVTEAAQSHLPPFHSHAELLLFAKISLLSNISVPGWLHFLGPLLMYS